ncbi:MAG: hypothetical protein P8J32_02655, partial [bacterium]|nr:hypothetical protein [bacterium]
LQLNHRYLVMEEDGFIQEWKVIEISKHAYKIQDNTDYDDDQGYGVDWVLKEGLKEQDDLVMLEDLGLEAPFYGGVTYTPNIYSDHTGNPWQDLPRTTSDNPGCCGGDCGCKGES